MAINSKVELCNLAISHLGNFGTISNIDTRQSDKEITFSLWYDISRQTFLKMTMPNFALARKNLALVVETPPEPFSFSYAYPADCLKVLGIGSIENKKNNYTVEGNRIYTNVEYVDGLPIRYIKDIIDVTAMSPEFKVGLSWFLAGSTAMDITQDVNKVRTIEALLPEKMSTLSGLNAQENMPIRISRSKFKQARVSGFPINERKR